MINQDEAPEGYIATKYTRPSDCESKCTFRNNDKKCRKVNCGANFRTDRTEVIFKEKGEGE